MEIHKCYLMVYCTKIVLFQKNFTQKQIQESVCSQRVIGVTTGATTIVDFPEGTGSPVSQGDYVALTGMQPVGVNTTWAQVASVNSSSVSFSFIRA